MYWVCVAVLIAFGMLAVFSIGAPFLLLGLVLAALFPWRHDVRVLAPGIAAVVGLVVGYVLVAPIGCTTTATSTGRASTSCSNLLGIDYSGGGGYNPSLLPALLAGLAAATAATVVTRWATARPRAATPPPGG